MAAAGPWAPLLNAGMRLVEVLAAASRNDESGGSRAPGALVETDARTGRSYLRLPVPEPQVVQQLGDALARLISSFET